MTPNVSSWNDNKIGITKSDDDSAGLWRFSLLALQVDEVRIMNMLRLTRSAMSDKDLFHSAI